MIIFNFDVLARPHSEFAQRVPIREGLELWSDLHQTHNGRLGLVVDECNDRFILEHWLKINHIKASIYEVLETTDPKLKAEKVHHLGMAIGRSGWYVDVDPGTITETLRLGIPSLLVANPYIIRPEWGPGGVSTIRPWDELVEEIDNQKLMQAEKEWGDPT